MKNINRLRILGIEMIEKAKSGHPGIVLGAAPTLHTLYSKHLNVNPLDTNWINRDRFILAAGHGSALLYSMLHLSGFDLSIDDLKKFRQLGSKTPGHPEYGHTDGIDATSGPLGQGIPMGLGMAISEMYLSEYFNEKDLEIIDYYTYVLCGDGDLQEGITQEAISLAGHLNANKLIVLYDSNDIQLDGSTNLTISENTKDKYEAMGWNYILVSDGENSESIDKAILSAKKSNKPSIIEIKTIIGFGSENQGLSKTHGAPLGTIDINKIKKKFNKDETDFHVEKEVYQFYKENVKDRGIKKYNIWKDKLKEYSTKFPNKYNDILKLSLQKENKIDFKQESLNFSESTRVTGGKAINVISENLFNFVGGSADLSKSTMVKGINGDFSYKNKLGRNLNFGVREHAMGAIVNGMTLSGLRGFGSGFFVFSDYLKPAIRMASLMKIPSLFIFTHDSVAVGEDGPTHQPIEQLSGLRMIPDINVIRPGNSNEAYFAFKNAIETTDKPTILVLSRQNIKTLSNVEYKDFVKGAYIAEDSKSKLDLVIAASGSELELALSVKRKLGDSIRIVSIPSFNEFDKLPKKEQELIFPKEVKSIVLEMSTGMEYYKYVDHVVNIRCFGQSGKGSEVIDKMGFDINNIIKIINDMR